MTEFGAEAMQIPLSPLVAAPISCFRTPSEKQGDPQKKGNPEEKLDETESEPEEAILCRQCRQMVAHASERITAQGAHRHTFANPHGIVFEIGLFRTVQGCGFVGQPTSEWSWFRGYSWQILVCTMCLTHLGWLFTSTRNKGFSALILDRIIEPPGKI